MCLLTHEAWQALAGQAAALVDKVAPMAVLAVQAAVDNAGDAEAKVAGDAAAAAQISSAVGSTIEVRTLLSNE